MKLRDTDKGLRDLVRRAKLAGAKISVGVHAQDSDETKKVRVQKTRIEDNKYGITMIQVAEWMEFGTPTVPARSFIRAWFDQNEATAKEACRRMSLQVLEGKISRDVALERLGQFFVGKIQERIVSKIPPPLAQSTINRKGSDTPLIDTGQLRSSITYKVDG